MRLKSQDEILNEATRKSIIEDIEGQENKHRKHMAYRRFEVWKDRTSKFVREMLHLQFADTTVREMEYALSNISVVRKVIDKLAKVYSNGVDRSYENDADTECLNELEKTLKATAQMKTVNRLLKLHRNTKLYVKPTKFLDKEGNVKFKPTWQPMSPYLYDVVEEHYDRTKSLVTILSNFELEHHQGHGSSVDNFARRSHFQHTQHGHGDHSDKKDQTIADKKEDENIDLPKKKYVWWTDKWHFTTIGSEIINPDTGQPFASQEELEEGIINPIEEQPFVDYHIDQEGHYWAEGGDDLIDGAILINSLLTNAHHIGVTQGFGQLVVTGQDVPTTVQMGPNKLIGLPVTEDSPPTDAKFITSNPPLQALANQVEMYLALLLTTNNLSTSGISAKLEGGMTAPSGIALALDKAESLEDVKDQRNIFECGEPDAWRITAKWLEEFSETNVLDEKLSECKIPVEEDVSVEFKEPQLIMSEAEKLADIKARQELGLNLKIELIMKDRGIDKDEAAKILLEIEAEKLKDMLTMMGDKEENGDEDDDGRGDKDESEQKRDL